LLSFVSTANFAFGPPILASIGFNTLTMESERYVCVREEVNGAKQYVPLDIFCFCFFVLHTAHVN
jgi:hypothetical protein